MTDVKRLSSFCKEHNIASDQIKWRFVGDASVKLAVPISDIRDDGWGVLGVAVMFALRELGAEFDVTMRRSGKDVDIIVEK